MGSLIVLGLIGGAVWAGMQSGESQPHAPAPAGPTPSPRQVSLPDSTPREYRGQWTVISGRGPLGALPSVRGGGPNLDIGPRRVTGSTGCNALAGPIAIRDGSIDASGVGHTEAGCPSDLRADLEETFVVALREVDAIRREADLLILTGSKTELRLRLVPPLPRVPLIGTRWDIDGLLWANGTVQSAQGAWFELRPDRTFIAHTGCRRLTATWGAEGDAAHFSSFEVIGACSGDEEQDSFLIDVFEDGFTADVDVREVKVRKLGGKRGLYALAEPRKRR